MPEKPQSVEWVEPLATADTLAELLDDNGHIVGSPNDAEVDNDESED